MSGLARHRPALERVASRFGVDGRAVAELAGGTRNHVYRVGRPPQAVVARFAGEGDVELGVFRESEVLAQRAAAAQALAPQVLAVSLAEDLMVEEWVPGHAWSREEATQPDAIRRFAQWLQAVHAVPPPRALQRVDFLESLLHYCIVLEPGRVAHTRLLQAEAWRRELGEPPRRVLCHHDLHHLNLVDDGLAIKAVDWEYAGLGDPVMDLASFACYQQLDEEATTLLVGAYGGSPRITVERLATARRLFQAVADAWGEVLASRGATKKQS